MYKYLLDVIKNMEGNVITIGIDDKLINGFKKNKKVNLEAKKGFEPLIRELQSRALTRLGYFAIK